MKEVINIILLILAMGVLTTSVALSVKLINQNQTYQKDDTKLYVGSYIKTNDEINTVYIKLTINKVAIDKEYQLNDSSLKTFSDYYALAFVDVYTLINSYQKCDSITSFVDAGNSIKAATKTANFSNKSAYYDITRCGIWGIN